MKALVKVYQRFYNYIFNADIPLKERSFVLFSVTVLAALYAAVPAGIPVRDGMQITFHAFGLPTARLVWHCPFGTSSPPRTAGSSARATGTIR